MTPQDEFLSALRTTLNHLYDPDRLRQSPLVRLFGLADRFDTPRVLQQRLVDAIESLKPSDNLPTSAEAWTTYEVLVYRYVQQLSQQAVADQLGFNVRHLRRKQQAAIESLALKLWQAYDLAERGRPGKETQTEDMGQPRPDYEVDDELAWLADAQPTELIQVRMALQTVLERAQPLAGQAGIALDAEIDESLPAIRVNAVALRQIVLTVLYLAIHRCAGGTIRLDATSEGDQVLVAVGGTCTGGPGADSPADDAASLRLAQRMTETCGGSLTLLTDETAFAARILFPIPQRTPILALDDNQDFLQLLKRYVADTKYRVITTRDPDRALQLAAELRPEAVLVDVMMPEVDGWEVLARLRQHPVAGDLSIIVCTILAQEDLAVSLGADAYLKKPLSQEVLLAALDAQLARRARELR
jgi:CheY-like chemotaxis protein